MTNELRIEEGTYKKEASFVDLLAICIRYRKVIIGIPFLAVVVSIILLYFLPVVGVNVIKQSYSVQVSVGIEEFPKDLQEFITIEPVKSLNARFSSIVFVQGIYAKHFPAEMAKLPPAKLNAFIQNSIIGKRLKFSFDKDTAVYTLSFQSNNMQGAEDFLSDLWKGAANDIKNQLSGKYLSVLEILENQIDIYNSDGKLESSSVLAKATLVNAYQKTLAYQHNTDFPFIGDQNIMILAMSNNSRSSMLVVVFFVAFFVSLVLAFLINSLDRIRNTPEELAVLKAALRRK